MMSLVLNNPALLFTTIWASNSMYELNYLHAQRMALVVFRLIVK